MDGGGTEEMLAHIREQHATITLACWDLAGSLRTRDVDEGLHAIEHICSTLLIVEKLIGFISRTDASRLAFDEARQLRERMLDRAARGLAAAIRDLPGAEEVLQRFLCVSATVLEMTPS